ncbi:hypothetical protein [Streptomyces sp. ISL-10]|uniref:hypothetical protein n=1 Tax=Streptomyces sp. ISL-10 TaxID=2819172 RepID=UPI002035F4B3|nr:hypothetical protein [Streptomyces sp. ISL-10]
MSAIEAVVSSGKAVISADDSSIVAAVQETLRKGGSATFYVTHAQAAAVNSWYWTPKRIRETEVEAVSKEEKARIEAELGVKETGALFSNRIPCECGRVYGAFEFVQQGIREHGREAVGAVLELKDTSVIRVNPVQVTVCPDCNQRLLRGHYYCWVNGYGCCKSDEI